MHPASCCCRIITAGPSSLQCFHASDRRICWFSVPLRACSCDPDAKLPVLHVCIGGQDDVLEVVCVSVDDALALKDAIDRSATLHAPESETEQVPAPVRSSGLPVICLDSDSDSETATEPTAPLHSSPTVDASINLNLSGVNRSLLSISSTANASLARRLTWEQQQRVEDVAALQQQMSALKARQRHRANVSHTSDRSGYDSPARDGPSSFVSNTVDGQLVVAGDALLADSSPFSAVGSVIPSRVAELEDSITAMHAAHALELEGAYRCVRAAEESAARANTRLFDMESALAAIRNSELASVTALSATKTALAQLQAELIAASQARDVLQREVDELVVRSQRWVRPELEAVHACAVSVSSEEAPATAAESQHDMHVDRKLAVLLKLLYTAERRLCAWEEHSTASTCQQWLCLS